MYEVINGGVTAAKGFKAAGTSAGIKRSGKPDMAMIVSDVLCAAAGTFTSNVVKAAPVIYDRQIVTEEKYAQVVVVNSGVANACTGEEGMKACKDTARKAAEILPGIDEKAVLVASTGVIGNQIPIDKICGGIEKLAGLVSDTEEAGHEAAKAIMTTDTVSKEVAVKVVLSDGTEGIIGGMCKGSGMIHPNMCTMLSFVTTDIAIDQALLQKALREDIDTTYNMVSVDGDTSTNDTCLLLSSGLAGNSPISEENEDYALFKEALHAVNETLAKKMAADGEGCTMMFECHVVGADTEANARQLARSVISSSLTKAAMFGHDANWGRILCALGYSGVMFDPAKVTLSISSAAGDLVIVENGVSTGYSEEVATKILSETEVVCLCDMHMGEAEGKAWGCDLTHEYVSINGDYRS
ncbi:MAG: bifunctional glutamate N-acetyltransferase/amino-acid acetyltransferase ArgJ [Lachnospiraceae bacterium]|nr:bifunctional glutamate N-acetyltransferase/amino-acid acetyltransferase ArgJ [Lachnospiraceae bacterium]